MGRDHAQSVGANAATIDEYALASESPDFVSHHGQNNSSLKSPVLPDVSVPIVVCAMGKAW